MTLKRQLVVVALFVIANFAIGLLARAIMGAHLHGAPKTCAPGLDCAAATWMLLAEWPIYLVLAIWAFSLAVVYVARQAGDSLS